MPWSARPSLALPTRSAATRGSPWLRRPPPLRPRSAGWPWSSWTSCSGRPPCRRSRGRTCRAAHWQRSPTTTSASSPRRWLCGHCSPRRRRALAARLPRCCRRCRPCCCVSPQCCWCAASATRRPLQSLPPSSRWLCLLGLRCTRPPRPLAPLLATTRPANLPR